MRFASLLIALLPVFSAVAQDAERGRALYETHCGGCHYERVHERRSSDITTLEQLRAEVARWTSQTRRRFSAEERADVVEYLNVSHYRIGFAPELPRRGR
jgi:mono/diheme cytochrome c family protein